MLSAAEARAWILRGLRNGYRRTFIKFGDGEFLSINGATGQSINGDIYTEDVRYALHDALSYFARQADTMMGYWPDHAPHAHIRAMHATHLAPQWCDYTTLLLQEDNVSDMLDFWKEVMRTGRPLTYVAPARMAAVASWLGAKHIVINDANAYPIDPQGIAPAGTCIIGAGFAAKPLIHHLHQALPDLSLLDVGSGFDVLAGVKTRQDQPDPAAAIHTFGL
jgi:hypothetical protein